MTASKIPLYEDTRPVCHWIWICFQCSSRGRPKIAYSCATKPTRIGMGIGTDPNGSGSGFRAEGFGLPVVGSHWIKGAFKQLTAKWRGIEIFMNFNTLE